MSAVVYEQARLDLCYDSLQGLSVGDALGAQFFMVGRSVADLAAGRPPAGPWEWTDDTEMACSVAAHLRDRGQVDTGELADEFAQRCRPQRGYGVGAVNILYEIRDGRPWQEAAAAAFGGEGSCGNGGAMRVAPLGAYHVGRTRAAAEQAARSAATTHAHPEGVAGAVAVAVAACRAAGGRLTGLRPPARQFLDALDPYVTDGQVRRGLALAGRLIGRTVAEAAYDLGNGSRVTAQDTVPFALWVAATFLDDYPAAIQACVEAGGDIDTTGAIVGGVVAAYTGIGNRPDCLGVPPEWIAHREPLPPWSDRPSS
jgi:ADP-ribosylglycohydrolase